MAIDLTKDKSAFYKAYHTRAEDKELNKFGYPAHLEISGEAITTEAQWQAYLETEIELSDRFNNDPDACEMCGLEYVSDNIDLRQSAYPAVEDQLDGIYKAFKKLKESGIDIGESGEEYLESIDKVKEIPIQKKPY